MENQLHIQERLPWYQTEGILKSLSMASAVEGRDPKELCNIGGNAVYFHMRATFGPSVVSWYRGTKDADYVTFSRSTSQLVLGNLNTGKYLEIQRSELERVHNTFDGFHLNLRVGDAMGFQTNFKADIYAPREEGQKVEYNGRMISKDKIIADPVQVLTIKDANEDSYEVAAPSVTDLLIMKTDVAAFSKGHAGHLRPKDKLDILCLLKIAVIKKEDLKSVFMKIFEDPVTTSNLIPLRFKFNALSELIDGQWNVEEVPDYPFLPNTKEGKVVRNAWKEIKARKDSILRSPRQ